jgi:hypothetical protein
MINQRTFGMRLRVLFTICKQIVPRPLLERFAKERPSVDAGLAQRWRPRD